MVEFKYQELSYTLRFLSPAFLGNAQQEGQWRTPPIKALLRQWWRVAYAAQKKFNFDIKTLHQDEGLLFGHAYLSNDQDTLGYKVAGRKSLIRLRLTNPDTSLTANAWGKGSQLGVAPLATSLENSYAWYGLAKRGGGQADKTAIKPATNEALRQLSLAVPENNIKQLEDTLALIHFFGSLGSRSRGGWGALELNNTNEFTSSQLNNYTQPLKTCLTRDWPAALASDKQGLMVWHSVATFDTWDKAMRFVARERKSLRDALKTNKDLRPALGFADNRGRMPSPLRWKLATHSDGNLKVRVAAFPHLLPNNRLTEENLLAAWQTVSSTLDSNRFNRFTKEGGY